MKSKLCSGIILFILFFMLYEKTNAQVPNWLWAERIGGTGNDYAFSIVVDDSGNVYSTGYFEGTVDFDPGPGTFNLTSTGGDIFISKLDASGNFVWAKATVGTGGAAYAIAIDASGFLYIAGAFFGTGDFDPGVDTFALTSNGGNDIFISKLDSSGNFIWAKAIGGMNNDAAESIVLDTYSNVYITGEFDQLVDFDPGPGIFNLMTTGNRDMFVSKLDSAGNFVWAKAMGGTTGLDGCQGISITLDASYNVYATGSFSGTVDFDPDSTATFSLTCPTGSNFIFISKLDNLGNFIWTKAFSGSYLGNGYSIVCDAIGNVYATGDFHGTVDFDPGTGTYNLSSIGGGIFISKLDSAGNFISVNAMGGGGSSGGRGLSLALDASANVYTTGTFQGTVDFDPGAGTFNLSSVGYNDIFISKHDSSGNFIWVKAMGGTNYDWGKSIALDPSGNIYAAGYFYSPSIAPGIITLINADNSGSSADIFITKIDTTLITGNYEQESFDQGLFLFPNPSDNHLTAAFANTNKKVELTITDITGAIIYTTSVVKTQKIEIDTKDFTNGFYIVQIQAADFIETKKLIVEK